MRWTSNDFFDVIQTLFIMGLLGGTTAYIINVTGISDDDTKTTPSETTIETVSERAPEAEEVHQPRVEETPVEVVVTTPRVEVEELDCLALNIYFESRSDNFAGKLAVADVVLNRVDNHRYPDTICEVVRQSVYSKWWKEQGKLVPARNMCQFSWFCDGLEDVPQETSAWEDAKTIAKSMLTTDYFRGITEGSTHYHALHVDPNWTDDRGMRYVGQIGQHKFYRWH